MHPIFQEQLREVQQHYQTGDHDLAHRRLLDCVIETEDAILFQETLDYCDWLETEERNQEDILTAVSVLLEKVEKIGVKKIYDGPEKLVEVDRVSKKYPKSGFRVSDIHFEMHLRKIVGLVGENGNGKTTLLRLLASELKPDSGEVRYFLGKDKSSDYDIKTQLIYIEQRIPRWYGPLLDNLQFAVAHYHQNPNENRLWTEMMIARLGLRPFRHLNWSQLSSGYRTRFELAKTLLRRPKILLLDEPLANLDIMAQQTILQDLKFMANSLSAPFSMILSSQHIYEVEKVSDAIVFIRDGKAQFEERGGLEELESELILELELIEKREQILAALEGLPVGKLHFNGGVYMLHMQSGVQVSEVMEAFSKNRIEPYYFRNISKSSRRYFIR
ncbi:MAG: ABC transporter ATP-binding protein [Bacteroidota bacterium]|nr:ABC transporter ATP-binding protein [Bacteroidota bacterium]MDX5430909.1 ABC transporter ATP-binding protein [Bacteroidota bacterium]MDX5469656.1 ABC transporter ATP-binding protein [Bacteroidota bacterium]